MAIKITERFAAQCSVVTGNSYDTCGTITRASLAHLNATQLAALYAPGGLWADFDPWFKTAIEMKACGTRTYGMYEWIMSGADRSKGKLLNVRKADRSISLLQPFIFGRQDSVINTDFWVITAGVTGSGVLVGAVTGIAGDWKITVVNRYGVTLDAAWFRDKDTVQIFTKAANGTAELGQWLVLDSESDGTTITVLIRSQNFSGSTMPVNAAPTAGILLPGLNNVSDFEKWCMNRPTVDPRKRVPFWIQTSRRTRCVDSEYQKWYARLMESNTAFAEFGDLPLAERNRQDERDYQKRFVHSFFFNKPLANQTLLSVGGWESLTDINTVVPATAGLATGLSGKLIGKRANFIGVFEQLRGCDRVRDLTGNRLNLYEFFDEVYNIVRARRSQGRTVTDVDFYTDSPFRANFQSAMMDYYNTEYKGMLRMIFELGKSRDDLGMVWDSYFVKHPAGVRINILSHEFFDDFVAANKAENQESRGRMLLGLDLGKPGPNGGSIYWAQIATNRKVSTQGDLNLLSKLDATYACVMENISQEITMTSETGTVVVECPANSIWIHNLSGDPPVTTGQTVPYGNLY